jgi:FxsC-like protein
MSHYFFFSYARGSYDNYLRKFFDELSERVRHLLGLPRDTEVGFFDQRDLELGTEWDASLVSALQSTRVMVSIYSPAYFNSEYCGREWEFFRRRAELFAERARAGGTPAAATPPVIKPVIWLPLREGRNPPDPVARLQYFTGDPEAPHNKLGLQEMRRLRARYRTHYGNFINQLADEILDSYELFGQGAGELPCLDPVPELRALPSAFHQPPAPPAPPDPGAGPPPPLRPRRRGGPKYVRFVFIAGDPTQFPDGARKREFYLEYGGGEWKPYYPEVTHPIMALALAEAGMLGMLGDELPFGPDLATEVRAAEEARSLVVVFVDGWTAELLPPYRQALENLDRNSFINCSIFVPWNVKDPETAVRADELKRLLRSVIFPRWSRLADAHEPIFFRDSIYSVEDLREQLRDTLRRLQVMMMKDVVEHARQGDLPRCLQSGIAKPVLSHGAAPAGRGAP